MRVIISFAEVVDGYYDAAKCSERRAHLHKYAPTTQSISFEPHIGYQECKLWGIIPLPTGILGQYHPLVLGLVGWVQAWVLQVGGYLGAQTTQRGATSNLITFIDSLNII